MQIVTRLNKLEVEFLSTYGLEFHAAMKKIIEKMQGPKLDDPKYWELKKEISKINEKLEKLQKFVDEKSGGY